MRGDHDQTATYDGTRDLAAVEFEAPYLIVAMQCGSPLTPPARLSLVEADITTIGRGPRRSAERASVGRQRRLRVDIADRWLSRKHLTIEKQGTTWRLVDAGSKNGSFVNGARVGSHTLQAGDVIEAGSTIFLFRVLRRDLLDPLDVDLDADQPQGAMPRTLNPGLSRSYAAASRIAASTVSVLIVGASGTGKEVAARALHAVSGRAGEFVGVNCAALAPTLLESELFGHKKGAFSGAVTETTGLIRAADGGTLFLDEVSELPSEAQAKLLRVLQEKEVVPVGGTKPIAVDLRVISATNQLLAPRIREGRFREDLYARLAGFELTLPSLAERSEDIGLLVASLLPRVVPGDARGYRFERAAARALFEYDWPLNVRELEQRLAAAAVLAEDGQLLTKHFVASKTSMAAAADAGASGLAGITRRQLVELLQRHAGNISEVSRETGASRGSLYRLCERLGVSLDAYRRSD